MKDTITDCPAAKLGEAKSYVAELDTRAKDNLRIQRACRADLLSGLALDFMKKANEYAASDPRYALLIELSMNLKNLAIEELER